MADQFDNIRVHKHMKKAFDKLCEKHDRGKSEMVQQMVEYFQISGIDPLQVSVATKGRTYSQLRKEIGTMIQKAVEDRFIGIEDKMDLLIRNTMGKEKETDTEKRMGCLIWWRATVIKRVSLRPEKKNPIGR